MKPVLLLIPGMFNPPQVFDGLLPHLQSRFDIRVASVTTQSSIAEMAQDAWRLVADVSPPQRLVVAGYSMGGYVALALVHQYLLTARPPASWAMALLFTGGHAESPEGLIAREKTIAALQRNPEATINAITDVATHPATPEREALRAKAKAMMLQVGAEAAIRQIRAIMARSDARPWLPQVAARVLVLGSHHDKVVAPSFSEELAALVPQAELAWFDECGHFAPVEQPEQVAQQLRRLA